MSDRYFEERFDSAAAGLCKSISSVMQKLPDKIKHDAQEIRLRVNRPAAVYCTRQVWFVTKTGNAVSQMTDDLLICTPSDILQSFHALCNYSVYSFQDEIKNGFITISGGHRVGLCGTAVMNDGIMTGVRDISSVNVRIARQINGAADSLFAEVGTGNMSGLLIAGVPSSGKTTLLRDIARQISLSKNGKKVVVVDERGEIGGTYAGICQNDLGMCDVLNGYGKADGIMQAVRCLSPDVIICDEIGSREDVSAINEGVHTGVGIIASIHAGSIEELLQRPQGLDVLHTGAFQQIVLLAARTTPGKINGIYKVGDLNVKNGRLYSDYCGRDNCGLCTST